MTEQQVILPNGRVVALVRLELPRWIGEFIGSTWGGKPVVAWGGQPMFAELAVLERMRERGWSGVWVETRFRAAMPPSTPVELPEEQAALLERIRERTGRRAGAWDVLCWNGSETRFIELKRSKHDRIRPSQVAFLEAALELGVPLEAFSLVEWTLASTPVAC
jgi:hypothetical protein